MLGCSSLYSVVNVVIQSIIQPRPSSARPSGSPPPSPFSRLIFWTWVLGPLGALLAVPDEPARAGPSSSTPSPTRTGCAR